MSLLGQLLFRKMALRTGMLVNESNTDNYFQSLFIGYSFWNSFTLGKLMQRCIFVHCGFERAWMEPNWSCNNNNILILVSTVSVHLVCFKCILGPNSPSSPNFTMLRAFFIWSPPLLHSMIGYHSHAIHLRGSLYSPQQSQSQPGLGSQFVPTANPMGCLALLELVFQ